MRKLLPHAALAVVTLAMLAVITSCSQPADVADRNLSKAADNFEIDRRVVFYNSITDSYLLEIRGRCALGNQDKEGQVTVTCKTSETEYKKHFLGLSDNVTYVVEQLNGAAVDTYNYDVRFRPETIIPDIDLDVEDD